MGLAQWGVYIFGYENLFSVPFSLVSQETILPFSPVTINPGHLLFFGRDTSGWRDAFILEHEYKCESFKIEYKVPIDTRQTLKRKIWEVTLDKLGKKLILTVLTL